MSSELCVPVPTRRYVFQKMLEMKTQTTHHHSSKALDVTKRECYIQRQEKLKFEWCDHWLEREPLERTWVLVRMLTWELTSNSSPKRLDAPASAKDQAHTENTGLHVDKMPIYCVTITV